MAFAAGAAAMLLVVLAWSAWRSHEIAGEALRGAASVVDAVRDPPSLPDAPRLPDAPIPRPK